MNKLLRKRKELLVPTLAKIRNLIDYLGFLCHIFCDPIPDISQEVYCGYCNTDHDLMHPSENERRCRVCEVIRGVHLHTEL